MSIVFEMFGAWITGLKSLKILFLTCLGVMLELKRTIRDCVTGWIVLEITHDLYFC